MRLRETICKSEDSGASSKWTSEEKAQERAHCSGPVCYSASLPLDASPLLSPPMTSQGRSACSTKSFLAELTGLGRLKLRLFGFKARKVSLRYRPMDHGLQTPGNLFRIQSQALKARKANQCGASCRPHARPGSESKALLLQCYKAQVSLRVCFKVFGIKASKRHRMRGLPSLQALPN